MPIIMIVLIRVIFSAFCVILSSVLLPKISAIVKSLFIYSFAAKVLFLTEGTIVNKVMVNSGLSIEKNGRTHYVKR